MKKLFKNSLKWNHFTTIFLLFVAISTYSQDIYVDKNVAVGTNDGTSWATAYTTITEAITNAVTDNTIHVAKGTYIGEDKTTSFNINKSLTLIGGYPTGGGTLDWETNLTILDGENSGRVVNISKGSTLKGFIIENGSLSNFDGAGLRIAASSTLENCIIRNNNSVQSGDKEVVGGGIYAAFNLTMINCKVINNLASSTNSEPIDAKGGGLFIKGVLTATNCLFANNTAQSATGVAYGGGLYVNKQADLTNTLVTKNKTISNNQSQEAFRLHKIFSSNMVLQRDVEIPIFGYADGNLPITVTLNGVTKTATFNNGKWKVYFPKMDAGGPYELKIEEDKEITLTNIMIGDVWLASGQSNMQYRLSYSDSYKNKSIDFNNDNIRLYRANIVNSKTKQEDYQFNNPIWDVSTEQSVKLFSSVGYYFAHALERELNVPIAVVGAYRGSTTADRWMPSEVIENNDNFKHLITDYENSGSTDEFKRPSALYNAMIHPLIEFPIKGVVWFQGESDAKSNEMSALYEELFSELIISWRQKWTYDFPFYYAQLAGYGDVETNPTDSFWARLRESQTKSLKNANTGMAVTIDLGEEKDIHPSHKKPVGERLALQALAKKYGQSVMSDSPIFKEMKITNNEVEITFDNIGQGLEAKTVLFDTHQLSASKLEGFAICGVDKNFVWANATIVNNKVILSHPSVPNPTQVRYGWAEFPLCNLYNKDGLPAVSFRTDNFN